MVTDKTKLVVAHVALWCLPGLVFVVSILASGSWWVAVAVALVAAVVARATLRRYVASLTNDRVVVRLGDAAEGPIEAVEVFWRPGCPFVEGLGRKLDAAGVPTHLRDISQDPDDAALVRSIAHGHETVPTLVIGPVALVNPSARLVMATLREHAPHLIGGGPPR